MSVFQKTLVFLSLFLFATSAHAQSSASSVDMFWEANSYVPTLYQGKALPTSDGDVRVFALPGASFGNASQASYIWKVNGTVLGSKSGVGRSSLEVTGSPFIDTSLVVVDVVGSNGQSGSGILRIPYTKPRVLLYEKSALGGILFSSSIEGGESAPINKDIVLFGYPYFFSTEKITNNLSYVWKIDESPINTRGPELVTRSENIGTSTVSVRVYSVTHVLQQASKTVPIVLH